LFFFYDLRGIPEATERTPEVYDSICDRIEEGAPVPVPPTRKRKRGKNKEKDSNMGIKERCLFNSLKATGLLIDYLLLLDPVLYPCFHKMCFHVIFSQQIFYLNTYLIFKY